MGRGAIERLGLVERGGLGRERGEWVYICVYGIQWNGSCNGKMLLRCVEGEMVRLVHICLCVVESYVCRNGTACLRLESVRILKLRVKKMGADYGNKSSGREHRPWISPHVSRRHPVGIQVSPKAKDQRFSLTSHSGSNVFALYLQIVV